MIARRAARGKNGEESKVKYSFITIEREYGSAGTRIARLLSDSCGVPCYGREILEAVADRLKISVESIDRYEESISSSLLYTISLLGQTRSGRDVSLPTEDMIFLEEQAEIRRLAGGGPAIFLGHCASEALRDRKGVARVFIWAGEEDKHRRIIEDYGIEEERVERVRRQFDRKRANYYFANTARHWGDFRNYDVVLNSSALGIDGCVALLRGMLKCGE